MYEFKHHDNGLVTFYINNKPAALLEKTTFDGQTYYKNPHEVSSWRVFRRNPQGHENQVIKAAIVDLYKAHTLLKPYLDEFRDPDFWKKLPKETKKAFGIPR